jgi:EAL domain-containing protein (putative c-di-GMP-specific phosphodiesterase class I)/nitrogen-specific signal transduction histidine kinase
MVFALKDEGTAPMAASVEDKGLRHPLPTYVGGMVVGIAFVIGIAVLAVDDDRFGLAGRLVVIGLLPTAGMAVLALAISARQRRREEQARIEAERRLEQEKKEFTTAVVEHLERPVRSISGFASKLRSRHHEFSAAQRREMIDVLADEASDLADLVEDLAQIAATREQLTVHPLGCDVRRLAETVALAFGPDTHAAIHIEGQGRAWADPMRVRQIIRNLVGNAFDRDAEAVALEITEDQKRTRVRLVDDGRKLDATGAGVFMLNGAAGEEVRSGLGLALSRELARWMTGDLIHRTEGDHTIFTLTLPSVSAGDRRRQPQRSSGVSTADVTAAVRARPPRVAFLPIMDVLGTGEKNPRIAGFEALSRFDRGHAPEWFKAAAEAGLRMELELTSVRQAIFEFSGVEEPWLLWLNVSPETLLSDRLVQTVRAIDPARVVFELPQAAAISNYTRVRGAIARLQDAGYRIAVDDVGAGDLDLWHLIRLEPDILKLDMSVVRNLHDPGHRALADAVITLANRIGAAVVAEGVERKDDLVAVRELGVPWAQGYFFGEPAEMGSLGWQKYLQMQSVPAPTS